MFSHYVDNHDYAMLHMVFTEEAVANFATSAGYVKGLPLIEQGLREALCDTISQHFLSTYMIDVLCPDTTKATSITYLQGIIFGQGNLTGQLLTTYGS